MQQWKFILRREHGKVRCTVDNIQKYGYAHANYVTQTAERYSVTKVKITGTVNADVLNVRSGASQSTQIIDKLYLNDKVEVTLKAGDWCSVKYTKNGQKKEGYVAVDLRDTDIYADGHIKGFISYNYQNSNKEKRQQCCLILRIQILYYIIR